MKVTDEHVHDNKALLGLIKDIIKSDNSMIPIGKLFADDGAYDDNEIFKFLADSGILPCIKVRKNAKVRLKKETCLETCQFWPRKTIYKNGRTAL